MPPLLTAGDCPPGGERSPEPFPACRRSVTLTPCEFVPVWTSVRPRHTSAFWCWLEKVYITMPVKGSCVILLVAVRFKTGTAAAMRLGSHCARLRCARGFNVGLFNFGGAAVRLRRSLATRGNCLKLLWWRLAPGSFYFH